LIHPSSALKDPGDRVTMIRKIRDRLLSADPFDQTAGLDSLLYEAVRRKILWYDRAGIAARSASWGNLLAGLVDLSLCLVFEGEWPPDEERGQAASGDESG
jgi:hypothetical protein